MEGCREGIRVETPKGPLSQAIVEEEGDGGGAQFSAGYNCGMHGDAEATRGEREGQWRSRERAGSAVECFSFV